MKKWALSFFSLMFMAVNPVWGLVRVGFIELKNSQGGVQQFEPNFSYAHVAIKIGNQWLHAYPPKGVQFSNQKELEKIGHLAVVLESASAPSISPKTATFYLGKPYDPYFSWSNDRIYCSELVAKLLEISPSPMHFDPKYWSPWYQQFEGKPGISPGKIYAELIEQGYLERLY